MKFNKIKTYFFNLIKKHLSKSVSNSTYKVIYVLLADGDGTLRSKNEPFGVAVETKEEAELFVKEYNFGYTQSYQEFKIFKTTKDAIEFWRKNTTQLL